MAKVYFSPCPKPVKQPKPQKQGLKRSAIKKKSGKIRPMSKKREAENKVYLMLREKFLRDNPRCAVTGDPASEVHHTYSGKDRSKYFLVVSTWLPVCRAAHEWIHNCPETARRLGYLK